MPDLCKLPSAKNITVFFCDGPISQDLAYGNLLTDGADRGSAFTAMLEHAPDWLNDVTPLGRYLNIQDSNADTTSDL